MLPCRGWAQKWAQFFKTPDLGRAPPLNPNSWLRNVDDATCPGWVGEVAPPNPARALADIPVTGGRTTRLDIIPMTSSGYRSSTSLAQLDHHRLHDEEPPSASISASKGIFMLSCPAILYRSVAGHPDGGKFRTAGHPALPESDGSSEGHHVAGSRHVPVGDSFWLNVPWLHYQLLDALQRFRSFDETQKERLRRKCTVCESGYVGVPTATRR